MQCQAAFSLTVVAETCMAVPASGRRDRSFITECLAPNNKVRDIQKPLLGALDEKPRVSVKFFPPCKNLWPDSLC